MGFWMMPHEPPPRQQLSQKKAENFLALNKSHKNN